jgi:anti-sigma regulatory factor (Ser/Thr protein kinase)
VRLTITTAVDDLARIHPWLDAEAADLGLPRRTLSNMHIVLEEAVMNVVMHAIQPGQIMVEFAILDDFAALTIEDGGQWFDPTLAPPARRPANVLEMRPGGHGLTLLRHYAQEMNYQRTGGRNRLTMRFSLAQAG